MKVAFQYDQAQEALQKYWNYSDFRPLQKEVIEHVGHRHNTIALLPTGGGKSMCYQVPALLFEGLTIVVSPLISLMEDQVTSLKDLGIKADAIHSGLSHKNIDRILDNCKYGGTKMLYVSPERLMTELFITRMKQMNIAVLAVDEAHCISQWGHDFRPSYLKIRNFIDEVKPGQITALTATATPSVLEEIKEHLGIHNAALVSGSFARENLGITVLETEDKVGACFQLSKEKAKTIIYVRSRRKVQMIAKTLQGHKISAAYYHAGLNYKLKKEIQKDFKAGKYQVIVATNAFGMGIDVSDIRQVVHFDLPPSLEDYYQEIGRAGRDGQPSKAVLLFAKDDLKYSKKRATESFPDFELAKKFLKLIYIYYQINVTDGIGITRSFDFKKIAELGSVGQKDVVLNAQLWEKLGLFDINEDNQRRIFIKANLSPREMRYEAGQNMQGDLNYMMRHFENFFDGWTQIDVARESRHLNKSPSEVIDLLDLFKARKIISKFVLEPGKRITFLEDRISSKNLDIFKKKYHFLKKMSEERWASIEAFVNNDSCKMVTILKYFGEEKATTCGLCDPCLGIKNQQGRQVADQRSINESGESIDLSNLLK